MYDDVYTRTLTHLDAMEVSSHSKKDEVAMDVDPLVEVLASRFLTLDLKLRGRGGNYECIHNGTYRVGDATVKPSVSGHFFQRDGYLM